MRNVRSVAAGEAQNAQQADEHVVERHVQANGGANVVGLAAVNDVAGFPQDRAGGEQDEQRADSQVQGRDLQEQVGDHRHQQHHKTGHHHAGQERHVFTGGQHVRRAAEEDGCGAAQRQHDQVARAGVQERTEDWTQGRIP